MGLEIATSRLEDAANWGRKFSLFTYPFVTACCGMEFMSVAAPKYDIARFGAEFPRFSPRQSEGFVPVLRDAFADYLAFIGAKRVDWPPALSSVGRLVGRVRPS